MKQNHCGNLCWNCSNKECNFIYTDEVRLGMVFEEGSKYNLKECVYFKPITRNKNKDSGTRWSESDKSWFRMNFPKVVTYGDGHLKERQAD